MTLSKEEINRKLLHIISGTAIPTGIFYLPQIEGISKLFPVLILAVLLIGSIALEFLRFRIPVLQKIFLAIGSNMLRSSEDNSVTGATYIFASAFICSVLFYNNPEISFIVISLFILGDAIAAIVGMSIGRIKIGKKSLEGSLACFILGLLLFFFVYPALPSLLDNANWNGRIALPLILIASLSNTIFELFPLKIGRLTVNDNLTVPVITGIALLKLTPLFY